ncbi:unnamed protein product, partial [Mesorhabditis belari]|uniref:G-protein coupled receptors family 1 profile domain-containing protein n=1 Tax=Mesorhabditis belari TaxID=2138241 RepID=A0AAF3FAU2_9BILA
MVNMTNEKGEGEVSSLEQICREGRDGDNIDYALWAISGPLSLLCAILSTLGNIYSLRILCKLNIRRSVRFYLSVLAIANACISQCTLWYYALSEAIRPIFGSIDFFELLTVFVHPVSSFFLTLSIWMMLTVTADRYFALSRPLQHRASESKQRAQRVTLGIILGAALFSVPTAFELRLSYDCDLFQNISRLRLLPTALRLDDNYLLIYQLLLISIFVYVGPLMLLTLLTFRMIFIVYSARKLRCSIDARASFHQKSGGNENTTRMLLTVVVKFLICSAPSMLLNVWEKIVGPTFAVTTPAFRYCVEWSNLLVVINSASDSIVYMRWWRQQKKTVTYSPIRKTIFSNSEASYLREKAQQKDFEEISSQLCRSLLPESEEVEKILEAYRIQGTIQELLKSIGAPNAERDMIFRLNEIGRTHKNEHITARQWARFKEIFIKEVSTSEDEALWTRFICMLIKEFRNGQTCALNIRSDRSMQSKVSQCSTFDASGI